MKMTIQQYMDLSPADAAKTENIEALLQNDRALYDLELAAKKKISPEFVEKMMPVITKQRDFEGSFKRYGQKGLNPLSNFKIFYDRLTEYSVRPTNEKKNESKNRPSALKP